ncbi:MAG TPA: hypothetical protein VLF62_05610 [Candidatus Saccharimonadales bacterium]|nr:hypothetical protein [Candidatus Saccharimonadales bacterium]
MAAINPAEYGVDYPKQFEPVVEPGFADASQAAGAAPAVEAICDEGMRLFGITVGEVAVHTITPGGTTAQ